MTKKEKTQLLTLVQSPELDNRDVRVLVTIVLSSTPQTITTLAKLLPMSRSSVEKSVHSLKRLGVLSSSTASAARNAKVLSVHLDANLQPKNQIRLGDIAHEEKG